MLDAALDYGKSVTLPVGELLDIRFSSELLNSFFVSKDPNKLQLELRPLLPKAIQGKDIPMRLTAGNNQQSATLDYVPFRVQQLGRKRARLVSGGPLPIEFVITVSAAAGENGSIRLAPKFCGAEVRLVQKVVEFVETLQEFGQLEVWCLDPNLVMLRQVSVSKSGLMIEPGFKKIVTDAVIVATFFNTKIYLPEKIRPSDWENLSTLKRIAAGEEFSDIDICMRLVKQDSSKDLVLDALGKERLSLRIEANTSAQRIKLFDGEIDPGPVIFETQEATVIRPNETLEAYLSADEESAVELKLHCDGACRYIANQRLM